MVHYSTLFSSTYQRKVSKLCLCPFLHHILCSVSQDSSQNFAAAVFLQNSHLVLTIYQGDSEAYRYCIDDLNTSPQVLIADLAFSNELDEFSSLIDVSSRNSARPLLCHLSCQYQASELRLSVELHRRKAQQILAEFRHCIRPECPQHMHR